MRYQHIVFLVYIVLGGTICVLFKTSDHLKKMLLWATLYAYILTAIFPYIFLWMNPIGLVLFYLIALIIPFFILSKQENPLIAAVNQIEITEEIAVEEKLDTSIETVTNKVHHNIQEQEEADKEYKVSLEQEKEEKESCDFLHTELSMPVLLLDESNEDAICQQQLTAEPFDGEIHQDVCEDNEDNYEENDRIEDNHEDKVLVEEVNEIIVSTPVIEENSTEMLADLEQEDVSSQDEVEKLIIDAFAAKDKGDHQTAQQLFQAIIEIDPGHELVELILENEIGQYSSYQSQVDSRIYDDTEHSLEQLLEEAFDAKFREDIASAMQICERILQQKPPADLKELIVEDIALMKQKIS